MDVEHAVRIIGPMAGRELDLRIVEVLRELVRSDDAATRIALPTVATPTNWR